MTCEHVRFPDGDIAIVCHRGKRWPRCSVAGCSEFATLLCATHARHQGRNRDYCPDHPGQLALPLLRTVP